MTTKMELYWDSMPVWMRIEKFPGLDVDEYTKPYFKKNVENQNKIEVKDVQA